MNQYSKIRAQLDKAQDEIGRTPERAVQWILTRLVDQKVDIPDIGPTDREKLSYEVIAFLQCHWGGERPQKSGWVIEVTPSEKSHMVSKGQLYPRLFEPDTLIQFQSEARGLINNYLAWQSADFPFPGGTVHCLRLEDGRPVLVIDTPSISAFRLKCAFLLLEVGNHLAKCKDCDRIFYFERRRINDRCKTCGSNQRVRLCRKRERQRHRLRSGGK